VVARVGSKPSLHAEFPDAEQIDCRGCVITPGLIDSHTHAVFGGWRAAEYEMRSRGLPYMEIARRGGGINASVRDVRSRSEDELLELSVPRVQAFASLGVTTVEIKSGYGLNTEHELKMLRVIRRLREHVPIRIAATFLGAHDFPPEYQDRRDEYVDLLVNEMIPAVAEAKLATFCDAFVEPGAFSADQARRVLLAGLEYGLIPRLHADEFENAAGAELAAELGAASADHLGAISTAGIEALAASRTVATLLPATLVFLGKTGLAPARALIDAGVTVALASDFNPGTAPTPNLSLSMTFACSKMGMQPLEALVAVTAGGARALRLPDNHGTLAPGAPGDLVVWGAADHREIPYRFGSPPVREVWASGRRIV
ncbi:MAG: imidazolonepropionase, partial [Longimicrobiales bacterium]